METPELVATLTRCATLAKADPELLETLTEQAEVESFATGDVVFDVGEESTRVYVVASGSLRAQLTEDGPLVSVFGPGTLFGEYAMFAHGVRAARVTAAETTVTVTIDPQDFRSFLRACPDAALDLLETAVRRLARAERGTAS